MNNRAYIFDPCIEAIYNVRIEYLDLDEAQKLSEALMAELFRQYGDPSRQMPVCSGITGR